MRRRAVLLGAALVLVLGIAVQVQGLAGTEAPDEAAALGTESQSAPAKASNHWLGEGKGDAMRGVIQRVFGKDLSEYTYICEGELWDMGGRVEVPSEYKALLSLAADLFVSAQEGEKIPLGYLCQGNTAYTVVEQPDGSLKLTEYALSAPTAEQTASAEDLIGQPDISLYRVVESTSAAAPRDVVDTLY